MFKRSLLFAILLSIAVLAAACSDEVHDAAVEATARALQTTIPMTATQRATLIPNPYEQLRTAQAQATAVAAGVQATMTAVSRFQVQQADATAQAFAPVIAELPFFGVDPNTEGRPGWLHPPLTLTAKGYHSYTYGTDYPRTVVRDGVLSSKITWNTRYGTGGCGFVLRANGDEQKPSQYVVLMTRGGWLFFLIFKDGQIANLRPIAIRDKDSKYDWHNDATNELTVVMRNDRIAVYTNRVLHKVFDPNEMPSLYVPVAAPPPSVAGEVSPPSLPPPPQPPASRDGLASYLAAVETYRAQVATLLNKYVRRLNAMIKSENNPSKRAALEGYRATILQERSLLNKSASAIQFYVQHPDADLNFGAGFLSFVAAAESSYATCNFHDSWLWVLDEGG